MEGESQSLLRGRRRPQSHSESEGDDRDHGALESESHSPNETQNDEDAAATVGLGDESSSRPRRRRWLLLAMFCALAFLQSSIFLAWNPIANSALYAFGPSWTPSTLAWQINLATITSPLTQYPVWRAMKKLDLSRTLRWGAVFPLVIATGINSLPFLIDVSNTAYQWMTFASFFFVGLTGVTFFSSITRFSGLWFPLGERATATGLSCTMANLGGILPSILGPQMVTDPIDLDPDTSPQDVARQIYIYMIVYFGLACLLFVAILVYFPRPPGSNQTSDNSEASSSESVISSLARLLRDKNVILITLVASLGSIPHIWGSTLFTVSLSPLKIPQYFIGAITTASLVTSTVLTVGLARLADSYFARRTKLLVVVLMPFHCFAMITLSGTILLKHPGTASKGLVASGYIIGIGVLNSFTPLILELAAELTFPTSEDIVSGLINQANNFFGVIFYLCFSYIPVDGGTGNWLLYTLMSLPVLTFLLFALVKEEYNRSQEVIDNDANDNSDIVIEAQA